MWWEAWSPADGTVERWLCSEVPELHQWVNDTITRKWDLVGGSRSPGSCCWRVCLVPAPPLSLSCLWWSESFAPPYAPCPNVLLHQTLLEATEQKDHRLKLEQIFPPLVCSFQVLLLTMTKAWLSNILTRQAREKFLAESSGICIFLLRNKCISFKYILQIHWRISNTDKAWKLSRATIGPFFC